ncbi:MAG: hypothetical protein LBE14_02540 [Treponema sp.]|jgi:hypothetical protein|nr:hypothetical protein [Treponema sp.]
MWFWVIAYNGLHQEISVTVSQKAALSLLISVFLFAGFAVLAFTGLFDLVETRFYNPSITKSLNREVSLDAETARDFLADLEGRFAGTLNDPAVRRSFLPNQSAEDIFERTRIYGVLLESLGGLQSIRFVDPAGIRIHFSTYAQDIFSQNHLSVAYRNYNEGPGNLPYDQVAVPNQGAVKFTLDEAGDRIIVSFPFYDSFEVYRGTALFTVSVRAVAERFISKNRIKVGDDVSIVSAPPGIVSGLPGTAKSAILANVASIWSDGLLTLTPLDSAGSDTTLALLSAKTSQGIFVGRLINETLFSFPQPMKVILLVSIFLTIYLIIFLLLNLRQDTMTVIQNRLKGLQISLIEQYYDHKGDMDWTHWTRELEQRREDIRAEVKRGIRTTQGRRSEEDIDSLIDKSWDELLAVISGHRNAQSGIDEEKLQSILNRVLQAVPAGTMVPALPTPAATPSFRPRAPEAASGEAAELEELDGEAEPVEELTEAEDAETLEELAEAEEPDGVPAEGEAEPVEELAGAEDAETLEELAEAEEPGEISAEEPAGLVEEIEKPESAGEDQAAAPPEEEKNSAGLLAAAAEKINPEKKPSNVRLAFGDDDIPYIVETSGLEMVDEGIDSAFTIPRPDDEPAELEELEELGELEELDEAEEEAVEGFQEPEAGPREFSENDIAEVASQIEFSPMAETGGAEDAGQAHDDLEIVSPFATMLSNISISDDDANSLESGETKAELTGSLTEAEAADLDSADSAEDADSEDEKKKTGH